MKELIQKVKESFKNEEVKLLLINKWIQPNDYWYNINKETSLLGIDSTGFCYLASELIYFETGKSSKWWFKQIISNKLPYNGHHFYLQDKLTNEMLDITSDQFEGIRIPYEENKNKSIRFMSTNCKKYKKLLEV